MSTQASAMTNPVPRDAPSNTRRFVGSISCIGSTWHDSVAAVNPQAWGHLQDATPLDVTNFSMETRQSDHSEAVDWPMRR